MKSVSLKGPSGIAMDFEAGWKLVPWRATQGGGVGQKGPARSVPSQSRGNCLEAQGNLSTCFVERCI